MKIPQYVKHPATIIIVLLIALSLVLPPAAKVSAQTGGTTESNLTIENFKWQDVLGAGWSFNTDYESEVDDYGASLSDFGMYKLAQPLTQPGKWLQLRLLGPKPLQGYINVDIYWTLDSRAIQDIKNQSFNSGAKAIPNCTAMGSRLCQPLYKEGDITSNKMMYVYSSSYAVGSGYGLPEGYYHVFVPNALIVVYGSRVSPDYNILIDKLRQLGTKAEELVSTIVSTERKTLIKLAHYHPFAPKDPSHQGGDIVATVTWASNPVVGIKVYLFKNQDLSDKGFDDLFKFPLSFEDVGPHWTRPIDGVSYDYWSDVTDKNGQITFNYVHASSIDYDLLATTLAKSQRPLNSVITAAVFDKDPIDFWTKYNAQLGQGGGTQETEPKVVAKVDVTLTFNFIARITNVNTKDIREKDPASVTVKFTNELAPSRGGKDTVLMTKIGGPNAPNRPAPEFWGYPLQYGDYIVMEQWDKVEVQWLSGVTLEFSAKDEWESYKLDSYAIWIGGTDAGWMDWLTTKAQSEFLNAKGAIVAFGTAVAAMKLSDAGAALGARIAAQRAALLAASGIAPEVAANSALVGAVPVSIAIAGKVAVAAGAVCLLPFGVSLGYHYLFVPIEIRPHSLILVDFNKNATIYTLEGTATVVSANNQSKADVTTNHSMQVTADGTFGKIATFKQSDLSPSLVTLAKDAQNSITLTAATPSTSQTTSSQIPATGQPQFSFPTTNPFSGTKGDSKTSEFLQVILPIIVLVSLSMAIGFVVRRRRKTAPVLSQPVARDSSQSYTSGRPSDSAQSSVGANRFCGKCANQISEGDMYCGKCGAQMASPTPKDTAIMAPFCPKCGSQAQLGERFCGKCGTALSVMSETSSVASPVAKAPAYCPRCGTPNSGGGRFCRKCGTQLIP